MVATIGERVAFADDMVDCLGLDATSSGSGGATWLVGIWESFAVRRSDDGVVGGGTVGRARWCGRWDDATRTQVGHGRWDDSDAMMGEGKHVPLRVQRRLTS